MAGPSQGLKIWMGENLPSLDEIALTDLPKTSNSPAWKLAKKEKDTETEKTICYCLQKFRGSNKSLTVFSWANLLSNNLKALPLASIFFVTKCCFLIHKYIPATSIMSVCSLSLYRPSFVAFVNFFYGFHYRRPEMHLFIKQGGLDQG